jgi:hypothetical protein
MSDTFLQVLLAVLKRYDGWCNMLRDAVPNQERWFEWQEEIIKRDFVFFQLLRNTYSDPPNRPSDSPRTPQTLVQRLKEYFPISRNDPKWWVSNRLIRAPLNGMFLMLWKFLVKSRMFRLDKQYTLMFDLITKPISGPICEENELACAIYEERSYQKRFNDYAEVSDDKGPPCGDDDQVQILEPLPGKQQMA